MRFSNKTVAITGAAVGIGRATAVKFAAEGAKVAAIDINATELESLKSEISRTGGEIFTAVCDVSDENSVNEAFDKIRKKLGNVDIIVNNAALWRDSSYFVDTPVDVWKKYLDINVMSIVYCTKAVLPYMIDSGWGRIINVASVAGVYGNRRMVHYSTTKGAVISMTKALAKEVCDKGVLVNAVSPGTVSPSSSKDYYGSQDTELCYMGRTGSDMENADLICFLASDEASYISGQNIQIDGCRKKI